VKIRLARRLVAMLSSAALAVLIAGCGKGGDEVAGTNSSTETGELAGLLVFQGGTAAPGAVVTLAPSNPVLAKQAVGAADTVVTDGQGRYSFTNLDSGAYDMSATLIKDGDTLVAFRFDIPFGKTLFVGTDTLVAPGKIQVKVAVGGKPVEGVTCYIPGTSFIAISGADGSCVISGIEPGTYDVAFLHPIYIGDRIADVEVLSGSRQVLADEALRADPAKPPPAPGGLSAAYDKATGAVTLRWDPVQVSDLDGYLIFRDTAASVVPTRITPVLKDAVFRDSAFGNLQDTSSRTLVYRIQAQDKDGNASLFSVFPSVTVTRPLLPASPNPADAAQGVDTGATLRWASVAGAGSYAVYLSSGAHADTLAASGLTAPSYKPASLRPARQYHWKVAASLPGGTVTGPEWLFTTRAADSVPAQPGPFRNTAYSGTLALDSSTALTLILSFWDKTLEARLIKIRRIDGTFISGFVYAGNTLTEGSDTLLLESLYKRALSAPRAIDTTIPGVDTNDIACAYAYDAGQEHLQLKCQGRTWELDKAAGGAPLLTGNYRGIAPEIITQPASVTVHPGDSAVFTVTATGTPALEFKWWQSAEGSCVPINTATTSTCTIRNLALEDNDMSVQATVSNPAGSVKSSVASIKVAK
jgi:hypothetical protein